MMKARLIAMAFLSLVLALPAFAETYKDSYPVPCSDLWPAVKDTLSNLANYTVKKSDDSKMTASYDVKHAAHVTITGALLQRTNRVTLIAKGTGCEMQVVQITVNLSTMTVAISKSAWMNPWPSRRPISLPIPLSRPSQTSSL